MKLDVEQLFLLSKLAIEAAKESASLIAFYADKELKVGKKKGGSSLASQVLTQVDSLSQDIILKVLRPTLEAFDLGLLTEESEDNQSRFSKDFFWCIDPLDGTLPFLEQTDGYAVSIALVSREGVPQIGVVVNPVNQYVYHAVKGGGAFMNGQKLKLPDPGKPGDEFTLICDRSMPSQGHFEKTLEMFKDEISVLGYTDLKLIATGGAVMNAIGVLENSPSCYFKFPKREDGGGSLWDYAATACIFNELGAIATDIYGDLLDLNRRDSLFMNHRGIVYCLEKPVHKIISNLFLSVKK